MSVANRRRLRESIHWNFSAVSTPVLLIFLATLLSIHFSEFSAYAKQTKEECRKCCEGKGYDEYFREQCKLKCFRDPDHCIDKRSSVKPSESPPPKASKRKRSPRSEFRWPRPLNLTPGQEWEAAAKILSLNGITPQHPNAANALQAVESILIEFVRTHPQGGSLPTTQLEQVIRRYR